jgi:WD40 repeat protein
VATSDRRIVLWDVATKLDVGVLVGHTHPVRTLTFASDGALASADDAVVLVWPVSVAAMQRSSCAMANRPLRQEEWDEYFPHHDYRPLCADLLPLSASPAAAPTTSVALAATP